MEEDYLMGHRENFINACQQGNIEKVETYLRSNEIDVNLSTKNGMTPLHYACRNGHIDIVQLLLQQGEININSFDNSGVSPIRMAASRAHSYIVKMLLQQKNIDIHQPTTRSFHFKMTPLAFACQYGHDDILELLIHHNININEKNHMGQTSFHIACRAGHENIVQLLLQQPNIDVNEGDFQAQTPLYIACEAGHENIVQLLLQQPNIDVNEGTFQSKTPLFIACSKGHTNIVKLLLQQNNIELNPLEKYDATPLYSACEKGHDNIVKLLLQQSNIELNTINLATGATPLGIACKKEHENVIKLLLQKDLKTLIETNNNAEDLLANAIQHHHIRIAKMLIEKSCQTEESLQQLKTFIFNGQNTCLLELAEDCPEILDMLNNIRHQKVKSARTIFDPEQDSFLKMPIATLKHGFFSNPVQTETNDFKTKPTKV